MNTLENQVTLYFRQGPSDKIYQASIEPKGSGFTVNFAFGRRGSTLNTGTKTNAPVDRSTAQQVYNKLVQEKKAKGYVEGPEGTPFRTSQESDRVSGQLPQLLNPITESELEPLLADPRWCLQEKFDGRRMLLSKTGYQIRAINRLGLFVGLPEPLALAAQAIEGDFLLDGEAVGDQFHAFDLLSRNGEDLRPLPYWKRMEHLLLTCTQRSAIQPVKSFLSEAEKRDELAALCRSNAEGVVLKDLKAPYTAGRPNSGGPALKYKFYATLTAVVSQLNSSRSVELRLLTKDGWDPIGNVTIPANHSIPDVGKCVEVRYLYAFPESNALFQPVFLGVRTDIEHFDCDISQLKFKRPTDPEP
jgi:predicted DNA-binding WGR domain protein